MKSVHTTAELRASGLSKREIARAVAAQTLIRVGRGRYALPTTPPDILGAARIGGSLSCISALRHHGAWVVDPEPVHVRVSRGTTPARGARIHWTDERLGATDVDDPAKALEIALRCVPFRHAVVVVDSLAQRRILPWETLESVCMGSARGRRVLDAADPLAESGIETLTRLRIRSMGVRVGSQVVIPGIGRVDLLVGDRLVIEVDGREFHADFERDRARDRALLVEGYAVVRISYRQVMDGWPEVEGQLRELIRRREHLRRPLGRTLTETDAALH